MAAPLQFAYRTQKAIGVVDADPVYEPLAGFVIPEGNLRCCVYSPCGRYFAWASNEGVGIVDASVGHVVTSLPLPGIYELGFSPLGTFIGTWERPTKDEAGDATKNLKVWRTVEQLDDSHEKLPLASFVQKAQSPWNLQYTADERRCARLVTNEVQFFDTSDPSVVCDKLHVEGVADFALAPGPEHSVAVFVPARKGQPAVIKVFNVPHFSAPVSQKSFFKGDKVQLKWNQQGSSLIVLAQTDVDKSNKSYYGETTLYLLSANGSFDARVALDKEGPIHDVSWSPNSKEFGVVYGFMPAKATIFNYRAAATHTFPLSPRNTIIFSPTGRFVLVAGFGNLAGLIDVYDLERDFTKVCTIESGSPSVCQWSPDSRYIMTATTSPRLRVDNGIKLWHVGGGIMYNQDLTELYSVLWRPRGAAPGGGSAAGGTDPLHPVPPPHSSALVYLGTVKTPSKPAGAYRPPGARGTTTPLHFKREDEGGAAHSVSNGTPSVGPNGFGRLRRQVPGAELVEPSGVTGMNAPGDAAAAGTADETLSKAALKNKKKRGNKKAKDAEVREGDGRPPAADGGPDGPSTRLGEQGGPRGDVGRSPERRYPHQHLRNQSRSKVQVQGQVQGQGQGPPRGRNRGNTQYRDDSSYGTGPVRVDVGPNGAGREAAPAALLASSTPPPEAADSNAADANANAADLLVSPGGSVQATTNAKKIRSLQKKLRAIEDLEMRLAGGEKLEDTQVKKISTKSSVAKELELLEKDEA